MQVGALIDYRLRLFGVPLRWRALITAWERPVGFVDEQVRGPFRLWKHTHSFYDEGGGSMRPVKCVKASCSPTPHCFLTCHQLWLLGYDLLLPQLRQ
jgi:hypothetical protein